MLLTWSSRIPAEGRSRCVPQPHSRAGRRGRGPPRLSPGHELMLSLPWGCAEGIGRNGTGCNPAEPGGLLKSLWPTGGARPTGSSHKELQNQTRKRQLSKSRHGTARERDSDWGEGHREKRNAQEGRRIRGRWEGEGSCRPRRAGAQHNAFSAAASPGSPSHPGLRPPSPVLTEAPRLLRARPPPRRFLPARRARDARFRVSALRAPLRSSRRQHAAPGPGARPSNFAALALRLPPLARLRRRPGRRPASRAPVSRAPPRPALLPHAPSSAASPPLHFFPITSHEESRVASVGCSLSRPHRLRSGTFPLETFCGLYSGLFSPGSSL